MVKETTGNASRTPEERAFTPEERAFIEWYRQQRPEYQSVMYNRIKAAEKAAAEQAEYDFTETGAIICADTVSAEADAIRVFSRLICNEWQSTVLTQAEAQELLFAVYGLEMLITDHAHHAQKLADTVF